MGNLFLIASVGEWINNIFQSIMLWIDSVIYWFASQCYQLFIKLAVTQIFSENFFQNFANRIYAILGVFMLFYLAYALLNSIVDPDKLVKGDKSVSKLASNLVISLVILGLLPSIFQYAYRLQNYVLSSNIIGSLIFGTETINPNSETDEAMIKFGDAISFLVLNTFINPDNYNVRVDDSRTWFNVKSEILDYSSYGGIVGLSRSVAYGDTPIITNSGEGEEVQVEYKVILSSLAGIYLCYIMLSFTLDLGVRVIKLAFCQLIAPIPIILRATPGKKGTFDKWLKLTLSVYFEVFVRVAIMYISIYFINAIADADIFDQFFSGGIQGMLAMVVVILGILTFAKQAPKMISDILGIDTGNLKFGIKDKLKASGALTGAAMIGAGATGLTRNFLASGMNVFGKGRDAFNAFKSGNVKSGLKNVGGILTGIGAGALSTMAGGTSGMFNAFKAGKDAKNYSDVIKAAGTGASVSWENKKNRANYVAMNNGLVGSAKARAFEGAEGALKWLTGTGFTGGILSKIKFRDDIKKVYDESYKELFENPAYKNMDALLNDYKAKQKAGVSSVDGVDINSLITQLEDNMRESRFTTISNNRKAVAYAAYNLAQFAKENYKGSSEAKFNLNGIDINDLVLKGNDVYRKSTNAALSEAELRQIFEGMDMNGNPILDPSGNPTKGVKTQIKELNDQNKELKQSIEYKELQKRQAAKKN